MEIGDGYPSCNAETVWFKVYSIVSGFHHVLFGLFWFMRLLCFERRIILCLDSFNVSTSACGHFPGASARFTVSRSAAVFAGSGGQHVFAFVVGSLLFLTYPILVAAGYQAYRFSCLACSRDKLFQQESYAFLL